MKRNKIKDTFEEIKKNNPDMSLDEILYKVYKEINSFEVLRDIILKQAKIKELDYYTKDVNPALKSFIKDKVFPEYKKNDGGHNLAHIYEVIRRSFALNDTFKLEYNNKPLDHNMIYAIASCHDWGKYENSDEHHLIAAKHFMDTEGFKEFFNDKQRKIIKEAIEDHRSSKEDTPRSTYGKLISSADRNTRIEIVFIRSFFVAHEKMPEYIIEDYLNYTIERLRKKYDKNNPENMFYEDETYTVFLEEMRDLLTKEDEFKNRYCEVNLIKDRNNKVKEEKGNVAYKKVLKR